ncbi:STAS domain-containing protein [Paludisphaera mucosa]|uniref:STAS domain-containing protein n=1 Tax=Paludisphaera mucosa TaxID=3030827 RepID=A0ABT6FA02_9BACT|nr:STAS domain-containing protein [Paludisphaera mucosa]MDG3004210.1 STAS domain-containing protein [Paludisphaera mucosa]
MLNFTTSEAAGVLIVSFEAVDEENMEWQFSQRDWLYKAIESREDGRFALDLTDIGYLASSEIGFLVTVKRRVDRRKGQLVLFGVAPYVFDIFKTMNLQKILDVADTRNAALAKLRN